MKRLTVIFALLLTSAGFALGQNADFPGVQKTMTPEQMAATGVNKLTPAEREKLDQFIRSYVGVSNKRAADAAAPTGGSLNARQGSAQPNQREAAARDR